MSERKAGIHSALQGARDELLAVLKGLNDADWQRATPAEGWTIKDIVAHVGVGETGNLTIAQRIIADEDGVVAGFDLDRYNQRQVEKRRERNVTDLLADLASARQGTLALLAEVGDAQLDKRGKRTTGDETTVEQVFQQIARHDQMHVADIKKALS